MTIQERANPLIKLFGAKKRTKHQETGARDLKLFEAMQAGKRGSDALMQQSAKDHLWMHFTRHSPFFNGKDINSI